MYSKKFLTFLLALSSLSVVAISAFAPQKFLSFKSPFAQRIPLNSISNLPGGDGAVLAVKIDDTQQAHPQIGIEDADIVYIEQVEGGLTRLAAIFSSRIPSRIGPIRSARISDIELLEQFGRVAFAYSGAQKKMRPIIDNANLEDLGAQNHSSTIYTTDVTRIQPYAMVLRADLLMQLVADKGLSISTSKSMGWDFGALPDGGRDISSVRMSWPASFYDAHWSQQENRWLFDHSGKVDVTESGKQLGAKTLVIQLVSITDSIFRDKVGGVTPFSATVGEGLGYILRNGKVFKAQWSRPTAASGTTWRMLSGEKIPFETGQIWVALTDKEPIFTEKGADAGKQSSK